MPKSAWSNTGQVTVNTETEWHLALSQKLLSQISILQSPLIFALIFFAGHDILLCRSGGILPSHILPLIKYLLSSQIFSWVPSHDSYSVLIAFTLLGLPTIAQSKSCCSYKLLSTQPSDLKHAAQSRKGFASIPGTCLTTPPREYLSPLSFLLALCSEIPGCKSNKVGACKNNEKITPRSVLKNR